MVKIWSFSLKQAKWPKLLLSVFDSLTLQTAESHKIPGGGVVVCGCDKTLKRWESESEASPKTPEVLLSVLGRAMSTWSWSPVCSQNSGTGERKQSWPGPVRNKYYPAPFLQHTGVTTCMSPDGGHLWLFIGVNVGRLLKVL